MSLQGKVVLITGAAGGFGQVFVRAFLDAGARVAAVDVNTERLAALQREAANDGASARLLTQTIDIGERTQCGAAVAETMAKFGPVQILVNNGALGMGVIRTDHHSRPVAIEEIDPAVWERFAAVNFSGAWYLTRAAIGPMKAAGWGRIITISTNFSTMLRAGFQPYGPCKAGLEAMAAGHAAEFRGTGVTVNIVVPGGPAATPMVPERSAFAPGALLAPQVMAPPVLWLSSDEASDVTGERFVAARWDTASAPRAAADGCRAPIGWPQLAS